MYTIVRADLTPNYQIPQSCHALADFLVRHPIIAWLWNWRSNIMVNLATSNLTSLNDLASELKARKIPFTLFYEPDISQHTAICTTDEASKILSKLPFSIALGNIL